MSTRTHCDVCDATIPALAQRHYLTTKTILPMFNTTVELCSDCGRAAHQFLIDRKTAASDPPDIIAIADEYAVSQAAKKKAKADAEDMKAGQ